MIISLNLSTPHNNNYLDRKMVLEIPFECSKCGVCCKNLLKNKGKTGLILHKSEINLFSLEDLRPHLAIGISPKDKDFKILTYQLKLDKCPHLRNNLCSIYSERPLICRGFPLKIKLNVPGKYDFEMSYDCSAVLKYQKRYSKKLATGQVEITFSDDVELNSLRESNNKLFEFWVPTGSQYRKWIYDLKNGKWRNYNTSIHV